VNYVTRFDPGSLSPDGFDYAVLADFASCLIIGARIPAGFQRGARHKHSVDQVFAVVDGTLSLELRGDDHVVTGGGVVFVPAGTPHTSWNETDRDEYHIDIMVPPPRRGQPFSTPASEHDGPPDGAVAPYVSGGPLSDRREPLPGFRLETLVDSSVGFAHGAVRLAEVQPATTGPAWHIHEFDQFYFVLDGVLTVEIAHERHSVEPLSLVAIPAGIAHRNWNEGTDVERHLAVLVPEPARDSRADIPVLFTPLLDTEHDGASAEPVAAAARVGASNDEGGYSQSTSVEDPDT
jgi:quercetin dioxygenase-like cupin family protein